MTTEQPNSSDEVTLQDNLNALATLRRRPVLLLNGEINADSAELLLDIAPKFEKHKQLSVLLNSPGGFIESAYKMILTLRRYVDDIEVMVPRWAKSAATFFCLGANTIYLGTDGELGPLDPQIR